MEGLTPIIDLKLPNNYVSKIKLDHLFTTGSYKDRGATILLSKAKELNIKHLVQDSSGNAGASIAAYSAMAKIECKIFVPKNTSEEKIVQIAAYGANLFVVDGDRKKTAETAFNEAKTSYYASHCFNPLFFQGTKTFAYEICEQLNWKAPDFVVLPAGNGTLLIGAFLGFKELATNGVINKIPQLIAVQSENCMPLNLHAENLHFNIDKYEPKETLAEGIAIPNPVRLEQMFEAIKQSNGEIITVSELEIVSAWKFIANEGHLIEPTSAATIAGLIKWSNNQNKNKLVVSLFSGSGLKSMGKIKKILAKS
jgi:threonine synthase